MHSIEFHNPSGKPGNEPGGLRSPAGGRFPATPELSAGRDSERRHRFALDSLYQIGSHIAFDDTLDETLATVLDVLTALVNSDSCSTYVLANGRFEPWVSKAPASRDEGGLEFSREVRRFLMEHRAPIAVSRNARGGHAARPFPGWSPSPGETFIALPLLARAKLVGAIHVQHAPRIYSEQEFRLLSTIGFLVGAEIGISVARAENAALYEQLETRKVVERGKGILQRELGLTEEQAYLLLQRRSRQKRQSMKEIAEAIITSEEVRAEFGGQLVPGCKTRPPARLAFAPDE